MIVINDQIRPALHRAFTLVATVRLCACVCLLKTWLQ